MVYKFLQDVLKLVFELMACKKKFKKSKANSYPKWTYKKQPILHQTYSLNHHSLSFQNINLLFFHSNSSTLFSQKKKNSKLQPPDLLPDHTIQYSNHIHPSHFLFHYIIQTYSIDITPLKHINFLTSFIPSQSMHQL